MRKRKGEPLKIVTWLGTSLVLDYSLLYTLKFIFLNKFQTHVKVVTNWLISQPPTKFKSIMHSLKILPPIWKQFQSLHSLRRALRLNSVLWWATEIAVLKKRSELTTQLTLRNKVIVDSDKVLVLNWWLPQCQEKITLC